MLTLGALFDRREAIKLVYDLAPDLPMQAVQDFADALSALPVRVAPERLDEMAERWERADADAPLFVEPRENLKSALRAALSVDAEEPPAA